MNSRGSIKSASIWRRRGCIACSEVFTTTETPVLNKSLKVRKKTGSLERFSEEILRNSLISSLSHKKNAPEASYALTITVMSHLLPCASKIIDSQDLASTVYKVLLRYDRASAVYYKAHYINA